MPTLKTRIQHTHDTEAKWNAKTSFVPKAGEVIVYDPDSTNKSARFKIGDGSTKLTKLPFFASGSNSPSKSMLDKASTDLLTVQYSTKQNGWRVNATQANENKGSIYFNDYELNKTKEYIKVVNLDPTKATTINIQRINSTSLPGDFSFDSVKLKAVLNSNPSFSSGTTGWNTSGYNSSWSIATVTLNGSDTKAAKITKTITGEVIKTADISWETNTTYELSFRIANYSASNYAYLRFQFAYYNIASGSVSISSDDTKNVTCTAEGTHYARVKVTDKNKWHTVKVRFTTANTLSNPTAPIKFLVYEANAGLVYLTDVALTKDVNLLPASWTSWTRETWYYPVSSTAPLKSDTAGLTAANNPESLIKCELNKLPGTATSYAIIAKATRLTPSYQWQDYITLTNADKYALMNVDAVNVVAGSAGNERPKMGGPWASVIEPEYNVKAVIDCTKIKASCVLVGAKLPNATKATVSLNTVIDQNNFITSTTAQTVTLTDGYCYTILPVPQEADYTKLEVIVDFSGLSSTSTTLGDNCLELVQVYGAPRGNVAQNTNFGYDYHGNVKCLGVYAQNYCGTIDDGRILK